MPATDPAKLLARELIDLRREVRSTSRASQGAFRSLEVDGQTVTLPEVVRNTRAATEAATAALTSANGKNTVIYAAEAPDGSTPGETIGDIWWQADPATGLITGGWLWSGTEWDPHTFGDGVLDSLTVGKLVTGSIAAGQRIIAGPESATHAELSDTGFRVFRPDQNGDGLPDEVIRLGTTSDDYFAIVSADGSLAASVDASGVGSFEGLSTQHWPEIGEGDHTGRGGRLLDILDRRPRGLVVYGASSATPTTNTVGGVGVFEVAGRMYRGRIYRVSMHCRINGSVSNDLAEVQIRWEQGGVNGVTAPAMPTINSPILTRAHAAVSNTTAQGVAFNKIFAMAAASDGYQDVRFLLSFSRPAGSGTLTLSGTSPDVTELWIEDIGPYIPNAQVANSGGGGPAVAPPQRYSKTWTANWARSYRSNGAISFDGIAYQGYGDSFNGAQRSYIGFPDLTGELAGATIESIGLYLYAEHWYANDGGIAVLGRHGYSAAPATYVPGDGFKVEDMTQSPPLMTGNLWPKPGGRWLDLMGYDPDGWAAGRVRGVVLGSTGMSTDPRYYGRFSGPGAANPPLINITYTK